MSSTELENEKPSKYYINEKDHRIHEDSQGQKWFMKAATGGYDLGFESIFYSQILDSNLKEAVLQKISNATGKMESLQHNGKWYNIFINNDEIEKSNISTKSTKKYDEVTSEVTEVKDVPKSSGGSGGQKRDRSIVDKWKYHKQPLEDAEKEIPLEKFWVLEKGVPPLVIQEGSEKYILTRLNHITFNY